MATEPVIDQTAAGPEVTEVAAVSSRPARREGPMTPEEMIDVRQRELRVDEAMVQRLIAEAKADYAHNLLEPLHAYQNPSDVIRHKRRLIKVLGSTAKLKSNGKAFLVTLLSTGFVFAALAYNQEMPLPADFVFALLFGGLIAVGVYVYGAFQEAFARVYGVERRDFTDPGYVTGLVATFLPRLGFYDRPEVWRGNDGRNGIRNQKSFVVLACGVDTVAWNYDEAAPDWDAEVWCAVAPGARITDLRVPTDYYDLPADTFTTDGIAMKHRRAWCRDLQRSGMAFGAWEKGVLSLLDGKWGYLVAGAIFTVALFLIILANG